MSRILQPDGWKRPRGYSNGIEARGRMIFIAGQVAFGPDVSIVGGDIAAQTRQALANIVSVLACAGATPRHVVRMTWYVVDMNAYRREQASIGEAYRSIMGTHFPAMTLVGVAGLVEPGALVEIEATAVVEE